MQFLKTQRICQRTQFQQILKCDTKYIGRFCVLYYHINTLDTSRLGIIASKRSLRLSVKRNQFKRIVRESFREKCQLIKFCDIVVIARRSASLAKKHDIRICIDKLLGQLI